MTSATAIITPWHSHVRNVQPLDHDDLVYAELTKARTITAKTVWVPSLLKPAIDLIAVRQDTTHNQCAEVSKSRKFSGRFEVNMWATKHWLEAVFETEAQAVQFMLHAAKEFYK